MPNVEVRDADGNVLSTYQIIADGDHISTEFLFDLAKLNAIEDELVTEERADELSFRLVE